MKKTRRLLTFILAFVMILGTVGCTTPGENLEQDTGNQENNEQAEGSETPELKVLKYSLKSDIPTLDQQLANSIPSATVGCNIFEGLTRTYLGELKPGAAESWDISDDGLVYTFHLRESYWSDGEPVTAQNFEYAIRRLLDPATASGYAFIGMAIKNASAVNRGQLPLDDLGVKVIDEKTLEITLEYPTEYFLSMLPMMQFAPVRQDMVEKYGQDYAASADKNAYNGPFVVKKWLHEDRLILEKNENYWDADSIKLDEVHVIVVADAMTALAMYEKGDLDIVEVPAEVVSQYSDKSEYYYNGANDFIKINMDGTSRLENRDLRLALNYAINRAEFVQLTTQGLFEGNPRYVLPQVYGVNGEYGDEYPYAAFPLEGDADKAVEHLNKAMEALGVSSPSDIALEILTTDADRTRKEVEVLKDQIERTLGIVIELNQVPYKQRLEMEGKHEFEMVVSGWAPDYSDPMTYLELWTSESGYNHGSYSSAAYDDKVQFAIESTDAQARMDALFEAEKILLEDGAIIPLQLRRIALLRNPKLQNFESYFVGRNYEYTYADFSE